MISGWVSESEILINLNGVRMICVLCVSLTPATQVNDPMTKFGSSHVIERLLLNSLITIILYYIILAV